MQDLIKERQRVAAFYMKLLAQTFEDCITKFLRKGIEPFLKEYVESFLAVAFFRIPQFRNRFIKCILVKSNYDIPEWSSAFWNIDTKEEEETTIS